MATKTKSKTTKTTKTKKEKATVSNGSYKLIIVESPAKAKTIYKILGKEFHVMASAGHIRDLPKKQLGVNIEQNFEPSYQILPEKKEVVKELKEAAKNASDIFLAPDPDREGEAIAWHLAHILKQSNGANIQRIEFNEITPSAVRHAVENPREIHLDRVNAQQARRLLDRLVGYKLSPLLWRKVKKGLSAGRVQSVAVRCICDRTEEIENFKPQEYWKIIAHLKKDSNTFPAQLVKIKNKKAEIGDKEQCDQILADLQKAEYAVSKIKKSKQENKPPQPFITSSLQQEAFRKHGFSVKWTMKLAQDLYEGISIGKEGPKGLITYMRTDSVRVSNDAQVAAREFIEKTHGKDYLPEKARQARVKKGAQDAHEAIRPTDPFLLPDTLKEHLSPEHWKLYRLIWSRFLASQMASAISDVLTVDIQADKAYTFRAKNIQLVFPGFQILYIESQDDENEEKEADVPVLSMLKEGEVLKKSKLEPTQHFTKPPAFYTEASLVRALEERGIGRPSTYAPIISTIQDRGYVEKEGRHLVPTMLGREVNRLLIEYFPDIVDVDFTANLEELLDKVATGKREWHKILEEFYNPFAKTLEVASEKMEKIQLKSGEMCTVCGLEMVIKSSRFGDFLACSGYPECTNKKPLLKEIGIDCPFEGCTGQVIQRKSRKGKTFFGCNNYPDCKFVSWYEPTKQACPDCNAYMLKKFNRARVPYLQCSAEECKKTMPFKKDKV